MHMYKVLASRSKGLDELRRSTTQRVVDITQKMMTRAMEQHPMFQVRIRYTLPHERGYIIMIRWDENVNEIVRMASIETKSAARL